MSLHTQLFAQRQPCIHATVYTDVNWILANCGKETRHTASTVTSWRLHQYVCAHFNGFIVTKSVLQHMYLHICHISCHIYHISNCIIYVYCSPNLKTNKSEVASKNKKLMMSETLDAVGKVQDHSIISHERLWKFVLDSLRLHYATSGFQKRISWMHSWEVGQKLL
jgi:hypothetical protein